MNTEQGVRLGAAERRKQLLIAARETFGTKGYTATSMNDVAIAAGVTKPVLYQHFESKQQLFLEVLTEAGNQLIAAISATVETASGGRDKLERAFGAYVTFFGDTPTNYQVIYGEGVRTEPEFAHTHAALIESFHRFTAEHIDIESLDQDLRLLAATAVAGQLEAVVGLWLRSGQEQSAEEVSTLASTLAWRGLRGTGSPAT